VVDTQPVSKKRIGAVAGIVTMVVGAVLGVSSVVMAQTGPGGSCSGDSIVSFGSEFYGIADNGNRLLSTSPTSREFPLPVPFEPGEYDLNGVSYDGYEGRELTAAQTAEQWYAEFLSANGTVLATSGTSGDIDDGVEEATWTGILGNITLEDTATTIRLVHAAPSSVSVNSVRPVCVGAVGGPPAPFSSITVNYTSTAADSANVALTCADLQESALGNELTLSLDQVPGSSGCIASYPAGLDCTVAVDPASTQGAASDGSQSIVIPDEGDVDVVVTIDCVDPQVAAVTTTTIAPAVTTTTAPATAPTTAAPTVVVKGEVETAPAAQAQPGAPAFTG